MIGLWAECDHFNHLYPEFSSATLFTAIFLFIGTQIAFIGSCCPSPPVPILPLDVCVKPIEGGILSHTERYFQGRELSAGALCPYKAMSPGAVCRRELYSPLLSVMVLNPVIRQHFVRQVESSKKAQKMH